jgi:hypothetical protein
LRSASAASAAWMQARRASSRARMSATWAPAPGGRGRCRRPPGPRGWRGCRAWAGLLLVRVWAAYGEVCGAAEGGASQRVGTGEVGPGHHVGDERAVGLAEDLRDRDPFDAPVAGPPDRSGAPEKPETTEQSLTRSSGRAVATATWMAVKLCHRRGCGSRRARRPPPAARCQRDGRGDVWRDGHGQPQERDIGMGVVEAERVVAAFGVEGHGADGDGEGRAVGPEGEAHGGGAGDGAARAMGGGQRNVGGDEHGGAAAGRRADAGVGGADARDGGERGGVRERREARAAGPGRRGPGAAARSSRAARWRIMPGSISLSERAVNAVRRGRPGPFAQQASGRLAFPGPRK